MSEAERTKRIFVEQKTTTRKFIHSSFESAFEWVDREIQKLVENGLQPGWKDRVLTGHVMLAAFNETYFDAVGSQVIDGWSAITNTADRFKKVRRKLTPDIEANQEPFLSVNALRILRNDMLHGSPEIDHQPRIEKLKVDQESTDSQSISNLMNHSVKGRISLDTYVHYRVQSAEYRKRVLEASGLLHFEIVDTVEIHETYLGDVPNA